MINVENKPKKEIGSLSRYLCALYSISPAPESGALINVTDTFQKGIHVKKRFSFNFLKEL